MEKEALNKANKLVKEIGELEEKKACIKHSKQLVFMDGNWNNKLAIENQSFNDPVPSVMFKKISNSDLSDFDKLRAFTLQEFTNKMILIVDAEIASKKAELEAL